MPLDAPAHPIPNWTHHFPPNTSCFPISVNSLSCSPRAWVGNWGEIRNFPLPTSDTQQVMSVLFLNVSDVSPLPCPLYVSPTATLTHSPTSRFFPCPVLTILALIPEEKFWRGSLGNSLTVQWVRLGAFPPGAQVWPLVRELRFYKRYSRLPLANHPLSPPLPAKTVNLKTKRSSYCLLPDIFSTASLRYNSHLNYMWIEKYCVF